LAFFLILILYLGVNPTDIFTQFHFISELARDMFPPNLKVLWEKQGMVSSLLVTISMAFLGTIFGGIIALGLAFFAATNTSPGPITRNLARGLLSVERSLPNFIVLLVLLIAVGIGPFAGMLALSIGSVGMFGKLFADAIEQADAGIVESIQSVGSSKIQLIRYGILPQVAPSFIANLFYAFDVNLRAAIPLGIFGGGGIGFQLEFADRLLHYKDVLAYTLVILVLITSMERLSDWTRRQILT
jgi:phosphonate transport system permease protein